jgi:8-oxo-dGTP diphosphatase
MEKASESTSIPRRVDLIDWTSWQAVDKATLLFVKREDELLLIRKRRGLGKGKINAPGGRLDEGESPVDGAIREVQEEVCVTPIDPDHRGQLYFQFVDGYSIHVWVFLATDHSGQACTTDEAIPLWTAVDEIPYDEMWADDRIWVPLMLERRTFSGKFIFDGDEMVDYVMEVEGGGEAVRR